MTTGRAARDAFANGLTAVYGYDGDVDRYDFSGLTDPQIASMILRDASWSDDDIASRFPQLWSHYLGELALTVDAQARALPGVYAVVDALAQRDDVMLAVLTGNIEPGARLKLGATKLSHYFPFGAFGSDSAQREMLPPIAVERAEARNGHRFSGRDVVIIGDSIYDVRCGVPHGARTIAVASGKTSRERLAGENPDFLFDSLEDAESLIAAILG